MIKSKSSRLMIACAGLLVAFALTPSPARSQQVSVGNSGSGFLWGAYYVADQKGFFREQGIEVKEVVLSGAQNTLNAVISGDVPYALGSLNDVILANSKKQQLRAIALLTTGFPNSLVVSEKLAAAAGLNDKSPIRERLLALKGKSIAVTSPGGPIDIVMRQMLQSVGLSPEKDVTLVYAGSGPLAGTAMRSGRVDAALFGSPWVDEVLAAKLAILWIDLTRGDYEPLRELNYSVIYARAEYLESHQKEAQALVNGILKAEKFIAEDKAGAAAAVRAVFSKMEQRIFDITFNSAYPSFPKIPMMNEAGFKIALDLLNSRPDQAKVEIPFGQVTDMRFLTNAK